MSLNYSTQRIRKASAVFGLSGNTLSIGDNGLMTMTGDARGMHTVRPTIQYDEINKAGVPTLITYGVNTFYSLPIYDDDSEEIFANSRVPYRWDGTTSPVLRVLACTTGEETEGHAIRLEVGYCSNSTSEILCSTNATVYCERKVLSGRTDSYSLYSFGFPVGGLSRRDKLSIRLRRIAATIATDVSNEVGITDWVIEYRVGSVYSSWS